MERRLTNIVLFILCTDSFVVYNPSSTMTDATEMCGPQKYFDKHRIVCLDLCGRYGEARCPIERFCSTRVRWGDRINPPRCLPRCFRRCDGPQYCDHDTHDCLPCDSLCSRPNITQCRKYCYDVYAKLTTSSSDTTILQDTTTSQTTTADNDSTTLVTPYEAEQAAWIPSQSHCRPWKTIAVVFVCASVILVIGLFGSILPAIIYFRQKSASKKAAGREAGSALLSTE